jgi:flagella basal body P-ring formation protein FlgA
MRALLILIGMCSGFGAAADTVVATQTLRAKQMVTEDLVRVDPTDVRGGATSLDDVIGFELKRAVYAGRPILLSNLAKAAIIERNQSVRVVFTKHALTIEVEARALERGSVGDTIQVMNLMSRNTILAEVMPNGRLRVQP